MSILVAFTQYLRWKDSDMKRFWKTISISVIIAATATGWGIYFFEFTLAELPLIALFFGSTFAAVANATYIGKVLKGNFNHLVHP
ncbi:MAG: hypothetical protein IPI91_19940 [Flavobacteriales bacterium]|nr:hypothetical protein [Flavobacteriales bacterium]